VRFGQVLAVAIAVATLLMVALTLVGCGGAPRVVERQVPVVQVKYCATRPPPPWTPIPAPKVCLAGFVCFSTPDAATLGDDDVGPLREWARETWTLCAPAP
jgi:hypothetical protein